MLTRLLEFSFLLSFHFSVYDKYLDTSTTLIKTIQGLSVNYILDSVCLHLQNS